MPRTPHRAESFPVTPAPLAWLLAVLLGAAGCGGAGTVADSPAGGDGGGGGGGGGVRPPPVAETDLDAFVRERMEAAEAPGAALAVVADGRLAWAEGFGWADPEARRPATATSIFQVASVSKTVVAIALLQAIEDGRLSLDDEAQRHLPFPLRHPARPTSAITVRMLATHTSGLADNWDTLEPLYRYGEDSPIALGAFLQDYLAPGGRYYDADDNFTSETPGTTSEYSNIGAALLAHLVERATGVPFDEHCRRRVFEPLGMTDSHWSVEVVPEERSAWPYTRDGSGWSTDGFTGVPDYPDGQLCTTAPDLARLLGVILSDGAPGGVRILSPASVALLQRRLVPSIDPVQGVLWYWDEIDGRAVIGHEGGEVGISTAVWADPATGDGVVVLLNGASEEEDSDPVREIAERLFADAR
jgi:CubicO group peptidase (beta-lactamase class C family)